VEVVLSLEIAMEALSQELDISSPKLLMLKALNSWRVGRAYCCLRRHLAIVLY
jgi:hypothetical protein